MAEIYIALTIIAILIQTLGYIYLFDEVIKFNIG